MSHTRSLKMLVVALLFLALGSGVYGKNIGESGSLSNAIKELQRSLEEQELRIALLEEQCEQSDNRVLRELQHQNETLMTLMAGSGNYQQNASSEVAVAVQAYTEKSVKGPSYLIFDKVELNVGDGYDAALGVFRAPVPGLYLVMVSITSTDSHDCYARVLLNGKQIRGAHSSTHTLTIGWNSASIQYLLRLNADDSLHVNVADDHTCNSRPSDRYSSFALTLLGN